MTDQQRELVLAGAGAYLVVAPPGSGKTEVLVQRVIHLLSESPGATFRILALTFTNKAAESLRSRVVQAAQGEDWRVFTGTFHAFCLELLQTYGESVGVTPSTTIMENDEDRLDVLHKALIDEGIDTDGSDLDSLRKLLTEIDRLKWTLVPPEAAPQRFIAGSQVTIAQAYAAFEGLLTAYGAIDFPGMLFKANTLLAEEPWVADHYQTMYRYVLVDEAQDLNFAQYQLLKHLLSVPEPNVMLVGDRNQAIYRFAGASPKYLDTFVREFDATEIALTTNFRSAVAIVDAANALSTYITHGTRQLRTMQAQTSASGSVAAWQFPTEVEEAAGVTSWVARLLHDGLSPKWLYQSEDPHVSPEDVCILARTRYALSHMGAALDTLSVGYVMRTGERGLFDSIAGQLTFLGMKVAANYRDLPSVRRLWRLLNPDGGEIDPSIVTEDVMRQLENSDLLPSNAGKALAKLRTLGTPDTALSELIESDFESEAEVPAEETELWVADRKELASQWHNYLVKTGEQATTLQSFLRFLSYTQRVTLDDPGVRVLTVHAAKGLEFKAVALIGMNDGMFPYYLSLRDPEELDDERRNAYVAISRAARALRLTRPTMRRTRSGLRQDEPSRFVGEMGLKFETPREL